MKWKNRTLVVTLMIPVLIVLILVYDAIAIYFGGTEASISSLIITSSYKMPFMGFISGLFISILIGHLFWRMKSTRELKEKNIEKV